MSRFEDCTIISTSPLLVVRDSEVTHLPADSLIDPSRLVAADRVRCEFDDGRIIIHGRADGDGTLLWVAGANKLRNADCRVNQRAATSATSLASGAYFLDGWKSGSASNAVTWTGNDTTGRVLTIPTGKSIQQIIERTDLPAGTYTLAWTGTSGARIYNVGATAPAYTTGNTLTVTLDGLADVTVEFQEGTYSRGMFIVGGRPVAFMARSFAEELRLAQRYFETSYPGVAPGTATTSGLVFGSGSAGAPTTGYLWHGLRYRVPKRATPTLTLYDSAGASGSVGRELVGVAGYTGNTPSVAYATPDGVFIATSSGSSATAISFHFTASAEL